MAQLIYTKGKQELMTSGLLPTGSEEYRLILLGTAVLYSPNAAHQFLSSVTASELVAPAPGYERKTLTGLAISTSGTTVGLTADMVVYTDIGESPFPAIAAGVVYRHVTDATDSWLLAYLDSITATTNGDDLLVTWDSDGIVYL